MDGNLRLTTFHFPDIPTNVMRMFRATLARRAMRFASAYRSVGIVAWVCGLLACSGGPSPEQVLSNERVEMAAGDAHEVSFAAPTDRAVKVTVSGRGIDVKVLLESGDTANVFDAPNRRMGVETVFVAPPHAPAIN